jgi:hypothetical protein
MEYHEFIVGEKLFNVGYKYFPNGVEDFNPFKSNIPTINSPNLKIEENIGHPIIIYAHIHHVERLFKEMKIDHKIILVTHNSDYSLDQKLFNLRPNNIIKWYSQNIMLDHPMVKSIPIGLENERWFAEIQKKNKILNKIKEPKNYINLMYMNHNVGTNRNERLPPYQLFGGQPWVSRAQRFNGQNFNDYIHNVYNHKFVLCPNGNGVDTHRLWETLYLNSIPIVSESININFYRDLPIVIVKDWKSITKTFLEESFKEITDKKLNGEYNLSKLNISYWINKIKDER